MNTYYEKYINFLIKHNLYNEEVMNYIRQNSTYFDYKDEEKRDFIGCLYAHDKESKLLKIHVCVPYIDSDLTALINIHEYIHISILYRHLHKKYRISEGEEILPMFYELLYYLDNPSKQLKEQITKLNSKIKNSSQIQYKIALQSREELLEYYQKKNPNFKKLQRKANSIEKKYQSKSS